MHDDLCVIDIGGTSIKFGLLKRSVLTNYSMESTPNNLEDFYKLLNNKVNEMKTHNSIKGIAISSPGAVDNRNGIIGGTSALPYIHNFPIRQELEKMFSLPVSIENDANCAALAEYSLEPQNNLIFIVIGTGIGGAIVINGRIYRGSHLLGGEFGYMLNSEGKSISEILSPVKMANRYNEKHGSDLSGKALFDIAKTGDQQAKKEVQIFYRELSRLIYNLQYSFDPDRIIIGGGISERNDLIFELNKEIEKIVRKEEASPIFPSVSLCKFKNDANLIGASVFYQQIFN